MGLSVFQLNNRILALLLSLPLLMVLGSVFTPTYDVWSHLYQTTLGRYISDSLILGIGVILGTAVIGGISATLCTLYMFPGRNLLSKLLLLPLVFPTYLASYAYSDIFSYGSWGYQLSAELLGSVPTVRSMGGALVIFSFVLYPYVYLLVCTTLKQQSAHLMQAAQALGLSPLQTITRLITPIIYPAIVAGCALVLMETLADYAAVKYLGVQSFSVGIFRTWHGLGSLHGAAQMSLLLLAFTITLLSIEKYGRRRLRYHNLGNKQLPIKKRALRGVPALAAAAFCLLVITIGFLLPTAQLILWLNLIPDNTALLDYGDLISNTLTLGIGSALFVVTLALSLSYSERNKPSWLNKIATSGYAVPGVIIAIGLLLVSQALEQLSGPLLTLLALPTEHNHSSGVVLSGSLLILYFAYSIRFMTVGFNPIENALLKISPNIDRVATSLGVCGVASFRKLHIPLIRPGVAVAAMLVFVEVVKEVPATLILRPFDFNTLAIHAYELAEAENLSALGIPSLFIILASALPLLLLWHTIDSRD